MAPSPSTAVQPHRIASRCARAPATSASKAATGQPSRARQDAPRRRWLALVSKPFILPAESQRARAMPDDTKTTAELDLKDAPRPTKLVLHPRVADSAYILAADRLGGLLFRATTKSGSDDDPADEAENEIMYLCSTRDHRAITLPAVPYSDLQVEPQPRRSVGLIADAHPLLPGGHYLVAQLCPRPPDDKVHCHTATLEWFLKPLRHLAKLWLPPPSPAFHGDNLLCFSTATPTHGWFVKPLHTTAAVRERNLCGETGVLAHAGRLYWLALAYGIFVCDPFAETSHLRFVPLPDGCQVWKEEELSEINRANVALRRRVAPSEGHLRYVEIRGVSYDVAQPAQPMSPSVRMWTLVDPEAAEPWRSENELEASFDDVWTHPSYVNFRLPYMEVPHVALVDPDNHRVVYFLQGSSIYGLDLHAKQVVSCDDCPPVLDGREIMLRNSRPIIDAWKWSPPTPPSPGDRWVIEHVNRW